MEQRHELEFSNQQKIKKSILNQERCLYVISLIYVAFIIACLSLAIFPGMTQVDVVLCIIVMLLVARLVFIWARAIGRQKKKWMNDYGQQITAVVTGSKFRLISLEWHEPQTGKVHHYKIAVPLAVLRSNYSDMAAEEQLPKRGLAMLLNVVPVLSHKLGLVYRSILLFGNRESRKRFELNLVRRHETGSQFPLWIDPNDPEFYCPDNGEYLSVVRLVTHRFSPSSKKTRG